MSEYQNSAAQRFMNFITTTIYETTPGDNFFKAMVFVGVSNEAEYIVADTPLVAGDVLEVTGSTYAALTDGLLKTWLADFFQNNTIYSVFIVMYTDLVQAAWDDTDIAIQYAANKTKAYWKTCIYASNDALLALDVLIEAEGKDKKLSALFVGSSDPEVLESDDSTSIVHDLNDQGSNAYVAWHYDTDRNAMLSQLGKTLSYANSTGTPVGNKLAMSAYNTIDPSGDEGVNLNAVEYGVLDPLHVAYFIFLGNATENVVLVNGGRTLKNEAIGANWIRDYLDYVWEIKAAELLSQDDKFLDAATYNDILGLIVTEAKKFVDSKRLTNFKIIAKAFDKTVNVASGKFVIPKAWQAEYVDDAGGVTVYGSLTVTL
jgi:hypothetical protein